MSNFPPPPPGQSFPPQPGGQQPYGVPGYAMPGAIQAQKTSGAAIASLVCGIIGCLLITPILAIILGLVGISKTSSPNVKGRGMAITGLILGILWLVGIGLFGGGAYALMKGTAPLRDTATAFYKDASANNIQGALANSTMTKEEITAFATSIQPYGTPKSTIAMGFNVQNMNGVSDGTVVLAVVDANGQSHNFEVALDKVGEVWKVKSIQQQK